MDFLDFSLKKRFLNRMALQLITIHKGEKSIQNDFRVITSNRMFSIASYIRQLAVKGPLISVNSDLIYNLHFHQVWQKIQVKSSHV